MAELYKLITSSEYAHQFDELGRLAEGLSELDVEETKEHQRVWKKRGSTVVRLKNVLRHIDTEVSAILEGNDNFQTAPAGKECMSSLFPGSHGANMDFNEVVAGVTMQFPVFEPGALFMLGDGHSSQGDGEIDGAAIETPFNVKFTVNLIKGKKINWPRLINDNEIMSIGSTRPLIDALRIACADMVDWLMSEYGFERYDAVQLLGQTAHVYIANVVDPQFSVACALNKKYLPR